MRRVIVVAVVSLAVLADAGPAFGARQRGERATPDAISGGSQTPGDPSGAGDSGRGGSGRSGSGAAPDRTAAPVGPPACEVRPVMCTAGGPGPDAPPTPGGPATPPAVVLAQRARESVTVIVPRPRTSPPEEHFQITGLPTWFWVDPDDWRTMRARAQVPGMWTEVTVTPRKMTWDPGDRGDPVTCHGPGKKWSDGASTDCGHLYTVKGDYTIEVTVTYAVTWRASTGQSGTQDPMILTTELPIDVQERQPVTN